jgi:4'-phosphopantetheinyl transferase
MNCTPNRTAHYLTQRQADLPDHENWLTSQETEVLAGLEFPKRRSDWLLGRWTAKSALSRLLPAPARPMTYWQIVAGQAGAPVVLENGNRSELAVSLSHRSGRALCVLSEKSMRIGCDLERVEVRSRSFEETWFTDHELLLLDRQPVQERARCVTLIWSAKECTLKALGIGLKADTQRVGIRSFSPGCTGSWNRIEAEDSFDGRIFHGWWCNPGSIIMSVLSDQPIDAPIELQEYP